MNPKLKKVLVYVIAFFVGILLGLAGVAYIEFSGRSGANAFFEIIIALILGYFVSTVVHEAGHLVFGLISGYGFSSFRIGSLMLVRAQGKLRLVRFKLIGTAGQCLMTPPKKQNGRYPVMLYNLGGIIFNGLLFIVCLVLFLIFPSIYLFSISCAAVGIFSLVTGLANGIPMNVGGVANDGMNCRHLSEDENAAEAFMNQLRVNEAEVSGLRLSEMPEEWFTLPSDVDKSNFAFSAIEVMRVNRLCEMVDTVEAERQIENLLNSGEWTILGLYRNLLTCDLISYRLLNGATAKDIAPLLTPELKKFVEGMRNFSSVIRTEYIAALLRDGDENEAEKRLLKFEKMMKNSVNTGAVASEKRLMDLALEIYKSRKTE